nr:uncharacterized protein LOC109159890 [Ipomoea trifida]
MHRRFPSSKVMSSKLFNAPAISTTALSSKLFNALGQNLKMSGERPWLPNADDSFVRTPSQANRENMKVSSLIDPHTNDWNTQLINDIFEPRDMDLILKIPVATQFEDQVGIDTVSRGRLGSDVHSLNVPAEPDMVQIFVDAAVFPNISQSTFGVIAKDAGVVYIAAKNGFSQCMNDAHLAEAIAIKELRPFRGLRIWGM